MFITIFYFNRISRHNYGKSNFFRKNAISNMFFVSKRQIKENGVKRAQKGFWDSKENPVHR